MGSQVSNWLYEKKDFAIKALTQWTGTIYTGANSEEVLGKLSTEKNVRVYGSQLFTDDGDFELIVRPFSRTIGTDLGSKTGCMTFNIVSGSPYQASINGLYGAIDLDNVIYQVFKACGLQVADNKLKHYNLAVRDRMGIGALSYYTGVVIKLNNGLLIGYVGKKVVQDIIDGMAAEGMFGEEYWGYDLPPINSGPFTVSELDWSNGHDRTDIIASARSLQNAIPIPATQGHDMGFEVNTFLLNQLDGIDYDFILVSMFIGGPSSSRDFRCFYKAYKISDSSESFYTGGYYGENAVEIRAMNGITLMKQGTYYYDYGRWNYVSVGFTASIIVGSYSTNENSGYRLLSTLNSNVHYIPPEGVEYEEGAAIPTNESHSISTIYPSWITTTNQTVSPARNISSRTLIALSFTGDTQYNTQAGVITSNEMLHKLGIYVESTEEYIPIGGEGGEDDTIIVPDAKPDPNDSPEDTYPDSQTPASKYMISVWNMTDTMVQNFAGVLWSNTVWNAIKDFFTKPTDAVIAMFTLYGVDVGTGSPSQEIKLGGHGTGVSAIPVTTRFKTVDLGNAVVPEFYANVEDYAPYSSAEIFLPFIGYAKIDVNEIMNSTVNVKYVFDMWTGSLVARIFVTRDGIKQELYNFNGSSAVQIPLTDRDYTNALSSLLSGALETARNVAVAAGITAATGGSTLVPALTGIAGGLSTIGNHAQGIKNRVVRSGSLGSIYGVMANKKACIYVKRPVAYNANNYQHYYGFPANWTCALRNCSGFTRVKDIHLDTVACTDEERIEIEQLLKKGVML